MQGTFLGREIPDGGFGFETSRPAAGDLIPYRGEAPITIIAPTGFGKGRDCIVPLLLTDPSPAIVIDIKGELSNVTARRRREMGHRVAVIDPFKKTNVESDRINPLDLLGMEGAEVDCDSEMIATMLGVGHEFNSDPFWSDTGCCLVAGIIGYVAALEESRSFAKVRETLFADDPDYQLALVLETIGKRLSRFAFQEISAYLQICSERTRPCVLSTARTFMRSLNSESVANVLENPTIDLREVRDGAPLDIFIVVPPEKLISHAGFLRVIVGTLLTAITRRTFQPAQKTLLVADEAAQLGNEFAPLLTATTLLRGYGLQLVSVWQDVAQMKSRYKKDWQTILNNSGAILAFGTGHYGAARDAAEFLGVSAADLLGTKPDQATLAVRGDGVRKIKRLNYLTDPEFAGLFDPNRFYEGGRGI